MDAELFVTVNIMTLSALGAAVYLARRDWIYAWSAAIHLMILLVGAGALLLHWPHPGWLTGILFVILVVAPALMLIKSQRRTMAGDTHGALTWLHRATMLQPTPIMRYQARFAETQAIDPPEARAAAFLQLAESMTGRRRRLAEVAAAQALDHWDQVLQLTSEATARTPELAVLHLRALGETGDIAAMLASYKHLRNALPAQERITSELFVLAFTGHEAALGAQLGQKHSPYDQETKTFWQAVAARAAGNPDQTALQHLAQSAKRDTTRRAALRHLDKPARNINIELPPVDQQLLDKIAQRTIKHASFTAHPRHRAIATLSFIAANCAMFAAELTNGGAENLTTLYNLGGMWAPSVTTNGQWWRLGSALFLHFGWLHLAVNMLSLYVLGRAVEARIGTVRMLTVYLGGGILSSIAVLALMQQGFIELALLVGASGAVMALFGGIIAYQVVSWAQSRDVLDLRPLIVFLGIVVLQSAIDLSMPNISLASHIAGLIAGFAIALPLVAYLPSKSNAAPVHAA